MRIQLKKSRPWLAAVAAAATMFSLVGCSGMSEESSGATPQNENCEQVDDVTIVLQWVAQAQSAGYFAAEDQGFFADHCLNVRIQEGGTNVVPQQVLASGNAEFAVSHVIKSMATREENANIVNISQIFQRGAYLEVSWAEDGIDELEDFNGKPVGSVGCRQRSDADRRRNEGRGCELGGRL